MLQGAVVFKPLPKKSQSREFCTKSMQDPSCHLTHRTLAELTLELCVWRGQDVSTNSSCGHCHSPLKRPQLHTLASKRLGRKESQPIQENKEPSPSHFLLTLHEHVAHAANFARLLPTVTALTAEGWFSVPEGMWGFNTIYWNKKRLTRGFAFCRSSVSLPKAM